MNFHDEPLLLSASYRFWILAKTICLTRPLNTKFFGDTLNQQLSTTMNVMADKKYLILVFSLLVLMTLSGSSYSLATNNDDKDKIRKTLGIESKTDDVSVIYEDIVVVQRKAKKKAGTFLLSPSLIFDFSDGPQTLYGINFNVGYAINDFWEVYLQTTPAFITIDRQIVKVLEEKKINVDIAQPLWQAGIEVLWLPAYGKDSWGPYSIIRSDTFFKLGLANLQTDIKSSFRGTLAIGKTFFLSNLWNLRVSAGASVLESLLIESKESQILAVFELGLVYYF